MLAMPNIDYTEESFFVKIITKKKLLKVSNRVIPM